MTTDRDPPTRDQVLDELELLAGVEHALVVEHLTLCCVLGHDLAAEDGGPTTPEGAAAADAARSLAIQEMFHLKQVSLTLAAAGRPVGLDRATSISSPSVPEIPLDPPGGTDLGRWSERGAAIAAAVDERFHAQDGPTHAAGFAAVQEALGPRDPAEVVRVTRREPDDGFEERLLAAGFNLYDLVVTALREAYSSPDAPPGFRQLATSAMSGLDDTHRLLVQRGLLPLFTS
ncbi:MAG TPA: hypothetical protein VK611_07410 [Acidimicrobiales bacterium]|nr:hypothetical protein [Acidimicrobiales bacterium]